MYTPSSVVAAVGAGIASFVDGMGNGDRPHPLPWYTLDWDILYFIERAFVLYLVIVFAPLIATRRIVRTTWASAYAEIERSSPNASPPEEIPS
jgi:hypothetical protein